jgi:hypothetical protein
VERTGKMKRKIYKPLYFLAVYVVLLSVIAFTPVKNIEIDYMPISEILGLYTKEYIIDTTSYKSSLRQILDGTAQTVTHFQWGAYLTYIGVGAVVCAGVMISIKPRDGESDHEDAG